MTLTIREEIIEALRVGFAESSAIHIVEWEDATDVYTSFGRDPITVWPDDIDIPDEYPDEVRGGITLDVQAILAIIQSER
jgi:hypothetical protein